MTIGPSPTRQKPERDVIPEIRHVRSTPARRRTGQTPVALFFKAIFRPILKGVYYLLRGIGGHKLLTLAMILLLIASIAATTFFTTGQLPYGIGSDPFNFHVHGSSGGGEVVQNWLYALRDGNASQMSLLEKNISSPPDPQQFINQFSQSTAHLTWKSINVTGVYSEADASVDSFVEVDLAAAGPGGPVTGLLLWHFVTYNQGAGILLKVNLVDFRAPLN